MDKQELYQFYIENCTESEIPLSFEEWEREIYPQDIAFIKENKLFT